MLHRPERSRKAVAATELAFLAPVVLTLLVGLWEVGRFVAMQNLLDSSAREAGRLASSGGYFSSNKLTFSTSPYATMTLPPPSKNTACELQQRVLLYLQASGLSTTNATVKVANVTQGWNYTYKADGTITGSGYDPTAAASQLDRLTVTVTLPYANGSWSPVSWFISSSAVMTASADWTSMADVPLTVSTAIPTKPLQPTDPLP